MRAVFVFLILFSTNALAERVLFIGDSLSTRTEFAKHMVQFLKHPIRYCRPNSTDMNVNGVFSYARPSSASRHWSASQGRDKNWLCRQKKIYRNGTARDESGAALCRRSNGQSVFEVVRNRHRPDTYVIALGGNSLAFNENYVKNKIKTVLEQMPINANCYWITPPLTSDRYLQKVKNVERWTGEVMGQGSSPHCIHIPSIGDLLGQTECEKFNVRDGLHHTKCGSKLWAKVVIEKMCQTID